RAGRASRPKRWRWRWTRRSRRRPRSPGGWASRGRRCRRGLRGRGFRHWGRHWRPSRPRRRGAVEFGPGAPRFRRKETSMFGIPGKQAVTLTPRAVAEIRRLMERDGSKGLRLGVKKGGCAGMEYTLDYATEVNPLDEVVEQDGARV